MSHLNFTQRFSILAILAMCLFLPAKAQTVFYGGLTYIIHDNNKARVSYVNEQIDGALVIPETFTTIVQPLYEDPYEVTLTVDEIGDWAFYESKNMTAVTLPKTIISIGFMSFSGCNALKDITCLATAPPSVYSKNSFYSYVDDIYTTATVHVPQSSITDYSNAYVWDNFTHFVGISGGISGDVDGDGNVTIIDVTKLIDMLLSGAVNVNVGTDVNGDGNVTILDVTVLIDRLLNKN
jgi:hypothetical protein